MKSGKKTALKIVICILIIFVLINVFWFAWRAVKYGAYSEGMQKNDIPEWLVPRYVYTDADGYDYSVKYPDYLSFTGNMSVGLPSTPDNIFTDFIVIWPKPFGGYKYGASLTVDDTNYQIYINGDGSSVYPENNELAALFQDTINDLLERAGEMWDLE